MSPARWRIRFLLLAAVTGTLIGALFFAQRASLRFLDRRLGDELGAARADVIVDEYADAFTAIGIAAVAFGAIVAFLIGHALVRQIGRLRADTIVRSRGEPSPPIARPPIAELQALASAIELLATEQGARIHSLTRERDDLALLVNSVSEGMLQVAPDGRIVHANPAARRLLGLPRGVTGEPVTAVVRNAELRSYLERALSGAAVGSCEINLDDRRILVDTSTIRTAGAGPSLGTVIAFTDFTEIRRLEGVRRDFVANVSHEIKTPLTSIRGYVETLMTDDLPPDMRRQFLDVIQKNAERLHEIVDDLLDLSRLESGGWRPVLGQLHPLSIARDVWATAYESADRKRIDFRIEGDDLSVIADPSGLRQVFSNLFDNAVRYTPEGGRIAVRVSVAAPSDPAPPDTAPPDDVAPRHTLRRTATIEVRDTGSGIPHDALSRIFERFYRVDPARSRAEGGTGLGLSIVKHLVESMGGDVTAESALGKGTVMRIRLPAA
jgi:signal transduction histidine kinase